MEPLKQLQTKDYIVQMLREEIFSGALQDGDELTQEMLAEKLDVSRMPVREALQQLELEGVVQRLPNRHMRVVGIKPDAVRQNFSVLAVVECEVAMILLNTDKSLQPLQEVLRKYEAAIQQGSLECAEHELEFHRQLVLCICNPFLSRVHEMLVSGYFYYAMCTMPRDWKNSLNQLKHIEQALEQKNADVVKTTLHSYFQDIIQTVIGGMTCERPTTN